MGNVANLATGGTVASARSNSAKLDSVASRMEFCGDWNPAEPLPIDQVAALPTVISAAEAALQPVAVAELARLLDRFFEWAEMLGLVKFPHDSGERQERIAGMIELFAEDVEHLPADILEDALRQVRRQHVWQSLPKPAEVLKCAAEELERRRMIKRRAEAAMAAARRESARPPMVPPRQIYTLAEMAAAEAWADRARAKIEEPEKRRDAGELRQIGKRVGFTAEELEASRKATEEALAKRRPAPAEAAE